MSWQIDFSRRKACRGRPVIDGGIVIQNTLRNSSCHALPVVRCRDALSFLRMAQKSSLNQNRRNFDISQHMKTRVPDTAVKAGKT